MLTSNQGSLNSVLQAWFHPWAQVLFASLLLNCTIFQVTVMQHPPRILMLGAPSPMAIRYIRHLECQTTSSSQFFYLCMRVWRCCSSSNNLALPHPSILHSFLPIIEFLMVGPFFYLGVHYSYLGFEFWNCPYSLRPFIVCDSRPLMVNNTVELFLRLSSCSFCFCICCTLDAPFKKKMFCWLAVCCWQCEYTMNI